MSETTEPETTETAPVAVETETERKRRRLRPNEVAMLKQYLAFADPGIAIAFNDLPDINMKRALFPSSQLRLVEKELLKPVYNENTGLLETVTIDEDMLKAYQWDLKAPEPRVTTRQRDPDEPKLRRPRGLLNNDKYKIFKKAETNPRREETHAWYNWEHCYINGLTIPQYLSRLDYPREIIVHGKFGDSWFNGPETLYLYQDFKAGSLGIYDSSKEESDPDYWLKPDAIEKDDIESPESEDANNENGDSPVVSETEADPIG
jgi:hypothetical protein